MKLILTIFSLILASASYAESVNLICMTGDATDMDIRLEFLEDKEILSVILTAMDGQTIRTYSNSKFKFGSLRSSFQKGNIYAIVSKSDLEDTFGGAYLDAGMINIFYNEQTEKYDVLFAAEGNVFTGACQ